MNIGTIMRSRRFIMVTWIVAGLICIAIIFKAGMLVGYERAVFTYQWRENYHKNFAGPRMGFMADVFDKDIIGSHGNFGKILSISGSEFVLQGRNETETIIRLSDATAIKSFQNTLTPSDLAVGQYVVVIGNPNTQGQVEAQLVRIMSSRQMHVFQNK